VKNVVTEKKVVNGKEKEWKYFELGPYQWWTFEVFGQKIEEAGNGLKALGLNKDSKFNIFSSTRSVHVPINLLNR
jgi:long-chain acyl-CoA synthetase